MNTSGTTAPITDELQIDTTTLNGQSAGSRPSSCASSSSGGVVNHNNNKHQQQHQHNNQGVPSPNNLAYKYPLTQPPFPAMLYPQPNGGLMPPGGPMAFQSPQHIMMMKMMMQQQQHNYQKHLANMAAASQAANNKTMPSPNGQQSPHQMSYSATFPNGNSTSFLNGWFKRFY